MIEPEFLEPDVVLFLHDQALREYGGIQGVKSEDLLHSALDRPLNKLAYADPKDLDLFDLAAAYAYGLAGNHPFNDGNKRTAWSSCVLFLKINETAIGVTAREAVEQMSRLASGDINEPDFARGCDRLDEPNRAEIPCLTDLSGSFAPLKQLLIA